MHRELSTGQSQQIKGVDVNPALLRVKAGMGRAQDVFEALVLTVLREVGRPMRSPELIEEFRTRGHALPGNEIRTAWNRLWEAKSQGFRKPSEAWYWIAGEPLSEEAKEQALIAGKRRNSAGVSAVIQAARGKKKGPTEIWGPEEIATAERMLLAGKSRQEVAAALGGVSQGTIQKYFPGGIRALQKKHPTLLFQSGLTSIGRRSQDIGHLAVHELSRPRKINRLRNCDHRASQCKKSPMNWY